MKKIACKVANQDKSDFILPDLPYGKKDLEPFHSEKMLNLHHGKHHQAYVTNLNNLVKNTEYANMSLEEIMHATVKDQAKQTIFNNAAQIWNHTFYWYCMKPKGGGQPSGALLEKISADFGSFDNFKNEFIEKATKIFGSGWCWLASNNGKLQIITTSNAANPITDNIKVLMTVDVWEHAYYPDYENRRAEFLTKFFEHLVNWDFVNEVFTGKCSDL